MWLTFFYLGGTATDRKQARKVNAWQLCAQDTHTSVFTWNFWPLAPAQVWLSEQGHTAECLAADPSFTPTSTHLVRALHVAGSGAGGK